MINRILLPTDGSPHAEHTIRFAIDLATRLNAELIVMYAYGAVKALRRRGGDVAEEYRLSLEEEAKELVQEIAERLRAEGLTVNGLAVEGNPAEAILRAVESEMPDLVVMGARGENLLAALFQTSVAEMVVRHSPAPVLVVK